MKENLVDEGVKPSLNIYVRPQSKKIKRYNPDKLLDEAKD